jgi:signal transduction histidine kinase
MKLLNRTSIYYIGASMLVFLLGGLFFFISIKEVIKQELTEKLWDEKARIEKQLLLKDSLPKLLFTSCDTILIAKIPVAAAGKEFILADTSVYEANEAHEEIPCRVLTFFVRSPHNGYKVTLLKSLIENDALIEGISKAFLLLIVMFLLALYLINRKISQHIWRPFYSSLKIIKTFDVTGPDALLLHPTDIDEFKELNAVVIGMAQTIQGDYRRLKEFTENASHEIQTPLAIIQSKLEMLIQSEKIDAESMVYVQAVYEASGRLSRLNKSLLLLTKIENNQFPAIEKVNLSEIVQRLIGNFEELIAVKQLTLNIKIESDIFIHPSLADILVSNLMTNAIKHNISNGRIDLELTSKFFAIRNTGSPPDVNPEVFFERFRKHTIMSESLGLGLSIVKKICVVSAIDVRYSYGDGKHEIRLRFPKILQN